jgi:regulator of sigma E protease
MAQILQVFLRILEFAVALGLLIFIHELGHYLFAKLFKIEVEEFGLGFPPRLVKLFRFQETDFTLNWIPFGAFARPKGENDPAIAGGMASAAPWKRLFILIGVPLMNIIAAVVLFSITFTSNGVLDRQTVQIVQVNAGSPAETAGLRAGDGIVSLQGQTITTIDQIKAIISGSLGKEVKIVYRRDGQEATTAGTPRANPPKDEGAFGIYMGNPVFKVSWVQSLPYAANEVVFQAGSLLSLPGKLIRGEVSGDEARVVGIVGMYNIYNTVREEDIKAEQQNPSVTPLLTIALMATISAALGITNLLPLPALDGGRILFVLPEILFRRRIPARYENAVHLIGFAALIVLMVVITAQDIINPIQLR